MCPDIITKNEHLIKQAARHIRAAEQPLHPPASLPDEESAREAAGGISRFQANELADTWDVMAGTSADRGRRETLRECADAVRMLANMEPPRI